MKLIPAENATLHKHALIKPQQISANTRICSVYRALILWKYPLSHPSTNKCKLFRKSREERSRWKTIATQHKKCTPWKNHYSTVWRPPKTIPKTRKFIVKCGVFLFVMYCEKLLCNHAAGNTGCGWFWGFLRFSCSSFFSSICFNFSASTLAWY